MRILRFSRCALMSCAAGQCWRAAADRGPIGAPGAMAQTSASGLRLNAGDRGCCRRQAVRICFTLPMRTQIASLSTRIRRGSRSGHAFSHPVGECVNTRGDVFIADAQSSVAEYAHGGTTRIGSLQIRTNIIRRRTPTTARWTPKRGTSPYCFKKMVPTIARSPCSEA